jgi:uncharacterized Zn-binding protein involved in type VI secretion
MPSIARDQDTNEEGGAIISSASTVLVNGKPVALIGDTITAHAPYGDPHPPHAAATITDGSSSVRADGKFVAWVSSSNTCGHSIVVGSNDVTVG